jgi:hypothetical protein
LIKCSYVLDDVDGMLMKILRIGVTSLRSIAWGSSSILLGNEAVIGKTREGKQIPTGRRLNESQVLTTNKQGREIQRNERSERYSSDVIGLDKKLCPAPISFGLAVNRISAGEGSPYLKLA